MQACRQIIRERVRHKNEERNEGYSGSVINKITLLSSSFVAWSFIPVPTLIFVSDFKIEVAALSVEDEGKRF